MQLFGCDERESFAQIIARLQAEIAARAQAAGVDVIIEQVPDVVHVWHALGREVPEASTGIDRVCEYIRSQCG